MQTKFCSAVVRGGHAYGRDDGILECVSPAGNGLFVRNDREAACFELPPREE